VIFNGPTLPFCEQIELRLLHPDDIRVHYALLDANRHHIGVYEDWVKTATFDHQQAFLQTCWERYQTGTGFAAAIWYRETRDNPHMHVGTLTAATVDYRTVQMSYWLAESQTGKGIATRTVKAASKRLLRAGVRHVQLVIALANTPSRAVAERANFRLDRIETHDATGGSSPIDRAVYTFP
jgi:ribosomal-protein-serine acetyltransferase